MNITMVYIGTALALLLVGLGGVLLKRNILKMVLALDIVETGVNLLLIGIGYTPGREAPIVDKAAFFADRAKETVNAAAVVDPVPQALVLTAIVIGLGTTALMLSYVIRLYAQKKTLDIREFGRLKW